VGPSLTAAEGGTQRLRVAHGGTCMSVSVKTAVRLSSWSRRAVPGNLGMQKHGRSTSWQAATAITSRLSCLAQKAIRLRCWWANGVQTSMTVMVIRIA
jgi:hypothetical protein